MIKNILLALSCAVLVSCSTPEYGNETANEFKPKSDKLLREPDLVKVLYPNGQDQDVAMEEGLLGPIHSNGLSNPEEITSNGFIYGVGDNARMEIYYPKKSNGQAIIVCPGGGYTALNALYNGFTSGNWLSAQGFTVIVLLYRMPQGDMALPMRDVTNAVLYARKMAKAWNVTQVGISGGSAGAHLAGYACAHPESEASRPDFAILLYPLLSMMDPACAGYADILAAGAPKDQALRDLSLEVNMGTNLPPIMVAACNDDSIIPVHQFADYTNALNSKGFNVELHMYKTGGHGWGFMTSEYAKALSKNDKGVWGINNSVSNTYFDMLGSYRKAFSNDLLNFTAKVKK